MATSVQHALPPTTTRSIRTLPNYYERVRQLVVFVGIGLTLACSCHRAEQQRPIARQVNVEKAPVEPAPPSARAEASVATAVEVHNVILNTASAARLKVKWLRGRMYPTETAAPASFDDINSFRLQIDEGLVGVNLADLSTLLRSGALNDSPLMKAKATEDRGHLKVSGILKKAVPLPVTLTASIGVAPDHHRVRVHVEKISVLKVPVKGLLGVFSVNVADFLGPNKHWGVDVNGNDIDIDVNEVLPPPRAHGQLTEVKLWPNGDLMQYYGPAQKDAIQVRQWRNFMRLRGGTVAFGKLTMHNTDLLLVDTSQDDWLTFDVRNYQEQLVNGITHITPTAGLQIFIPDIDKLPPSARARNIPLQWMKNRNTDPPAELR